MSEKPTLAKPRRRSHISGQRMLGILLDGLYVIPKFEPHDSWDDEVRSIMARQRGRRDPSIPRGDVVARMAFEVAVSDIDKLLALIASELEDEEAGRG